jgi:hypothetical protein
VLTLGGDDVTVTGPNGFSATAALISIDNETNGSSRTATYQITAPTGTWSRYDNGTYTVTQAADAVRDTAGNARPAGTIGTFAFNAPFAWKIGADLYVEHGPEGTPIGLTFLADNAVQASEGAATLSFSPIFLVSVHGSAGDDTLEWNGPGDTYTSFDGGGGGNDHFHVKSGFMPLGTDYSATTTPNLAVTVDAGAAAGISTRQRLRALNVSGTLTFESSGRDYTVLTRALTIGPTGRLDMRDKDLIVDPLPGDATTDVQAYLAAAYDFGAWDLPGLATSMTDATVLGLTTLSVAPASEVLFISGDQTAPWNGHTVSARATLVKYTYGGDVNLDGLIDAGDYGIIDNFYQFPGTSGYWNGDFNFDGVIDAGDYGIIDNAYQLQGTPL